MLMSQTVCTVFGTSKAEVRCGYAYSGGTSQKNLMTEGEDAPHEVRGRFTGTKELL